MSIDMHKPMMGEGRVDAALLEHIARYVEAHWQPVMRGAIPGAAMERSRLEPADYEADYIWVEAASIDEMAAPSYGAAPSGLHEMLEQLDESFSNTVLAIIDAKGFKDSEVYKRINMSRQTFSKLRSRPDYTPSKETAQALCFALELTREEADDLLGRAGFALSPAEKRDVILSYFLENCVYDVDLINSVLYEFDQPLLWNE